MRGSSGVVSSMTMEGKEARQFRELADFLPQIVFELDRTGRITFLNRFGLEAFGLTAEDLDRGIVHCLEAVSPEEIENAKEMFQDILAGKPVPPMEWKARRADGTTFYALGFGSPIIENGEPVGIRGGVIDITERKAVEEALKESEKKYRDLTDLLPHIVFEVDMKGTLTFLNRFGQELLGINPKDLSQGLDVFEKLGPEQGNFVRMYLKRLAAGERPHAMEWTIHRKDRSRFNAFVNPELVVRDGNIVGVRGVVLDLSEREKMEETARRDRTFESLTLLANGIAHDFNNILTSVINGIEVAKNRFQNGDSPDEALAETEKALSRATHLTQQLLTFSRGEPMARTRTSLADLLREAAGFVLAKSKSRSVIEAQSDLWNTDIDRGQIVRVMENLLINADQAMPDGGSITIRIENVDIGTDLLQAIPDLKPGRYVAVRITDQGSGIPPEHLGKIFDPYFTTKKNGTGLGLAISYSIIKEHGGHIQAASMPGRGSVFTVFLPVSNGEEARPSTSGQPSKRGRILLMDDDQSIRKLMGFVIQGFGHEVVTVGDGKKAVEEFASARKNGSPYDAVILDVSVPNGMGGEEAARSILSIDPAARIIISSGYSDDPLLTHFGQYGFSGAVKKPYNSEELSQTLTHVIENGSACR